MCVFVLVVAQCPRLCSSGRDRVFCFERELALFLRALWTLVYGSDDLPVEFDVQGLLSYRGGECGTIDEARYQALFGQYFRFDVSQQRPYFYREVQKFLKSICGQFVDEFEQGWIRHLSLMPFDPTLMFNGSMDRLVDRLVATVSVLSFSDLCESDDGGIILRQYREVVEHFKRRWTTGVPVIDDIVAMWMSYPNWSRCQALLGVVQVVFGGMIHGCYRTDFRDLGVTVIDDGVMLSSLNLVRSWMSSGFVGQSRCSMTGFTRHCQTTDMQTSRLQDESHCVPWEQLLKVGINDLYDRCSVALGSSSGLPEVPVVDEYRSTVCEQLRTLAANAVAVKSPAKKISVQGTSVKATDGRGPRTQTSVGISSGIPAKDTPKRKQPTRTAQSRGNRGQRTDGVPTEPKKVASSSADTGSALGPSGEGGSPAFAVMDNDSVDSALFAQKARSESSEEH